MSYVLLTYKIAAVASCAAACGLGARLVCEPGSSIERAWRQYTESTERSLRGLFVTLPVHTLALAQLAVVLVLSVGAIVLRSPRLALLIPVAIIGPTLCVAWLKRVRIRRIEASLEGFALSLSNALRTTPSIGNALVTVEQLTQPPLNQELALTLREMRLGTSLDEALGNMAERIQSVKLDATISSLMIARQVGGDVAQTLATTAHSLREMGRLEGVVRTKTAAGRAQLWLLAFFPITIVLLFDTVSPGYFAQLGNSALGWMVVAVAIALWVLSLLIARKVLAVEL